MTARPIDGAEGYRFFLRHEGQMELEEINHYLRGIGLRESDHCDRDPLRL